MRSIKVLIAAAILTTVLIAQNAQANWPTWRGPDTQGVATGNPPTTWSETENVKWKVPVPGKSSSTPIVWGDKLFIQTAVSTGTEAPAAAAPAPAGRRRGHSTPKPSSALNFDIVCMDRNTGEIIWQKTARTATPHEGHHPTGSHASYSPVTDGKYLWASFGSRGLYCFDLDGNLIWERDLIQMTTRMSFGEGSSPSIAGDAVVVLMDHEGDSKLFAFNKLTGEPMWERDRREATSWATPLPVEVDGKIQIITSATSKIISYDAVTGDIVWECDGVTLNAIPTPVVGFGNVYCTSGFRGYALKAIQLGHTGDLTDTDAIKWEVEKGTPYVASPLLYKGRIYFTSDLKAQLSSFDAQSGNEHYSGQRLEGLRQIYSSPVGAGDKIYITDRSGTTIVLKASDNYQVLATNSLDEGIDASPVVIGDQMYLKGEQHLYCISAD